MMSPGDLSAVVGAGAAWTMVIGAGVSYLDRKRAKRDESIAQALKKVNEDAAAALGAVSDTLAGVAASVSEVRERIVKVEAQYENNGGSTTRDAIDRIEAVGNENKVQLTEVGARLASHITEAAYNLGRVDRFMETHGGNAVTVNNTTTNPQPAPATTP